MLEFDDFNSPSEVDPVDDNETREEYEPESCKGCFRYLVCKISKKVLDKE